MFKMGQEDVKNYLKKKKKWVSMKEIAKDMKPSQGTINNTMLRLRRWGQVHIQFKDMY